MSGNPGEATEQAGFITLKIKSNDGTEVFFRTKRNTKFRKLMIAYCDRKELDINTITFLMDGTMIKAEQTPDELQLEEGDEIDAFDHQIGGASKY
ncbi:hypothetical protein MKW98_020301 [Papaver atlanticum]|uniref:Ubiquitin-like domain-containing protein n=1 Tax=Papaver atlanticum TaxID=357466 RepID=A0AAD4TBG5_9MAGN|nr:hypothetical protein MKW98_020301 [Papaver atlanticum]